MSDDPYAGIATLAPDPQPPAAPAQSGATPPAGPASDPYAAFATAAPDAPSGASAPAGGPVDHGATTSGMLGFLDGVPFAGPSLVNGAQKTGAAIATLRDGGTYADHLAKVQNSSKATADAHPWAHAAGEVAGGVVGTAPAIAAAPEAFGIGGGGLATRMLTGAATGAGIGAGDGAARSDATTVGGKLTDAGFGGAIGGAAGGLAPGIGAAAGAIGRRVFGTAVRDTAEVPQSVRTEVMRAVNQDAPLDPLGRVEQLGPQAMLADGGPSLQGIAMGQAAKDGAGAPIVLGNLKARDAGTSDRILGDLSSTIGPAQNADAIGRQIADVGEASTQPYFQRAYQAGVPQGADLNALMQRPAVASAVQDAATAAANRGTPFPTVTFDGAGNQVGAQAALDSANAATRPAVDNALGALLGNRGGTIGTAADIMQQRAEQAAPLYAAARATVIPDSAMPVGLLNRLQEAGAFGDAQRTLAIQGRPIDIGNVEPWDLMKRSLDDRIGTAQRAGENHAASVYQGLKNELTGALDDAVPAYAQARQSFAGNSDLLTALRQGQQAAGTGVTREQVAGDFAQLGTDGERELYRLGLGNAFRENLSRAGDTSNFADRVAGNQQLRDKLATVAPSQEALDAFNQHMDVARQTFAQAQVPTPQGFHGALDVLDARAPGDPAVAAARDAMATRLGQNPDFAQGRALQADYGNPAIPGSGTLPQALDAGRTALRGGPNAIHPEDYASAFTGRSPAAQEAQRVGLNSEIYRQLGDKPNDLVALKNVVKGDNDRSRSILGTTFGPDAANTLAGTADREGTFAKTSNDVLANSMTARRTEAIASQKAAAPDPYQLHERPDITWEGAAYTAGVKPINALLRAMQPVADTTAHDAALSRVVTATGEDRKRLLVQILQNQAAEDANGRLADGTARVGSALSALSGPALARLLLEHRQ